MWAQMIDYPIPSCSVRKSLRLAALLLLLFWIQSAQIPTAQAASYCSSLPAPEERDVYSYSQLTHHVAPGSDISPAVDQSSER